MVTNACNDLRRKKSRKDSLVADCEMMPVVSEEYNPSVIAEARDEMTRINRILSRLPLKQAEVIRWRVFDGLRLSEIAEI